MKFQSIRRFRQSIVLMFVAVMFPLPPLPARQVAPTHFSATPAQAASTSSSGHPETSTALGPGQSKPIIPQEPIGDFRNPPPLNVPSGTRNHNAKGDHFKPGVSRLVGHTANADIYDNGDGTESAEIYAEPINYKDDKGRWQKINSQLVAMGGKVRNTGGSIGVELNSVTAASGLVKVSVGANSLSFDVDGITPGKRGVIAGNSVTYPDAFPNADLRYEFTGSKLKESIILKSAPAYTPSYHFPLSLSGLHGVTEPDGTIVFQDTSNVPVISVDQGIAWDSASPASRAEVKITLSSDGKGLDVTPDAAWLQDPARVYPVTIDPTLDTGAGQDTFAESSQPNANFNVLFQNGAYRNWAGQHTSGIEDYAYMYFDLSAVANKQILGTQLNLFMFEKYGGSDPLSLWPVAEPWNASTLTWANKPNHGPQQILHQPTVGQYNSIDVTQWVANWVNGSWANHGFSIDTAGRPTVYNFGAMEMNSMGGQAPYLRVTYDTLPPASQPTSPPEAASLMSTTPTLMSTSVVDPDGDTVRYWYRVSNTNNPEQGQVLNSGWQTSPSWTIPAGSLINGVTYTWYVITWDGVGSFVTSPWRQFKVNLRLGEQSSSPMDAMGPLKVNLVNGNVSTSTSSPSIKTVGGNIGLSYSYNAQAQSTGGLTGKYYPGCDPDYHQPVSQPYLVRTDPNIDFNWGLGSPSPSIGADGFCASWDGFISAPRANTYCFSASSDDGVRVVVNGTTVVDNWSDGGLPTSNPNNCIALYPTTLPIHIDYYENGGGAAVQVRVAGPNVDEAPIPASWLSTTPSALPIGWQLSATIDAAQSYVKAIITDNAVVLVDPSGDTYEYRKTGTGATTAFTPPPNERTTLLIVPGSSPPSYQAIADDGFTYTFNEKGALIAAVSNNDDLHPAAAQYDYSASSDTARLSAIKDPVSGRQISLKYSTGLYGGSPCADAPAGFSAQGPVGMLCQVDYPDGSATYLYYSSAAATGQLMRIVDPGNEVTDFSYDAATGLLNGIADSLQMDWRSIQTTAKGAYTRINYSGNKAASVVLASPDGTDGTDVPPTINRPWHAYTYTSPFSTASGGETRVTIGGMSPPQGFASKVTFNQHAQTLITTDATGVVTENVWDAASPLSDRLLATKNHATGHMTTTLYDTRRNLPTDTYGPAPASCFGADQKPNGSCAASTVPHTSTAYDEGMHGLAIAWWNTYGFAGTPVAHSTKIRSEDNDGRIEADFGTPPYILGGQSQNWSLRATGEWYTHSAGAYTLNFWADAPINVWIDDIAIVTGGPANPTSVRYNATQGWHRIRIDYTHGTTSGGQLKFYVVAPGASTSTVIPATDLRPNYNLVTTTTMDDVTPGSPARVIRTNYGSIGGMFDPAYGLALSTTEDPGTGRLNLTSSSSYETPRTANKYMRQLTRTLPAGNSYTYSYYGNTETAGSSCTGASVVNQGGLLKNRTSPTPASGSAIVEHFVYDVWGRITASWRNNDSPTCTSYDRRGRVSTVSYPANASYPARTVTTNYAVGGDPLTTSISDPAGTITMVTDLLGRTTRYTDVWGRTTTTSYDLAGRVTRTLAPGDARQTDYDSMGRIAAQKAGKDAASLVTMAIPSYNSANELISVSYPTGTGNGGNGTSVTIGRDVNRRVNAMTYAKGTGLITSDAVTYSQSGRIVDQSIDGVDPHTAGSNFTYDGAGRLTEGRVPGHHYTYSFAGSGGCGVAKAAGLNSNRTSMSDNGATAITYCYDNADRLTSTSDSRYGSIAYDSHGNTTRLGTSTMAYDIADRHRATTDGSTTVTYTRDALDRIVSRTAGKITTRYSFSDGSDSPAVILDGANVIVDKELTLVGGATVDIRTSGGKTTVIWNYANIHGDIVAQADAVGSKLGSTRTYDPFGSPLNGHVDNATGNFDYGWLGSNFRGTEREGTLNTIEMGARQYVPGLGRFIEVDPVEGGCSNDYVYVNDPVNQFDLDGKKCPKGVQWSLSFFGYGDFFRPGLAVPEFRKQVKQEGFLAAARLATRSGAHSKRWLKVSAKGVKLLGKLAGPGVGVPATIFDGICNMPRRSVSYGAPPTPPSSLEYLRQQNARR